jgi:hypothetical protein
MTQAIAQYPDNIFLWLCDIANQKRSHCDHITEKQKRQHLELFLHWLALPRVRQVDDMLPYLRTFAGIATAAVDLKSARSYFTSMVPDDAPTPAKRLFLEIVEGVFMIYLHTGPQD